MSRRNIKVSFRRAEAAMFSVSQVECKMWRERGRGLTHGQVPDRTCDLKPAASLLKNLSERTAEGKLGAMGANWRTTATVIMTMLQIQGGFYTFKVNVID